MNVASLPLEGEVRGLEAMNLVTIHAWYTCKAGTFTSNTGMAKFLSETYATDVAIVQTRAGTMCHTPQPLNEITINSVDLHGRRLRAVTLLSTRSEGNIIYGLHVCLTS